MQNLNQGSELQIERRERLAQAEQNEIENSLEVEQVAPAQIADKAQWLNSKNKQLDAFIQKLEQNGVSREKIQDPS